MTDEIVYLDAVEESRYTIAQATATLDKNGKLLEAAVLCRSAEGEAVTAAPKDVEFMDVAPAQIVSVSTALIPFLEHDDANRALMGANMQRQAVPLLVRQAPLVGTGLEYRAAVDSGDVVVAEHAGTVVDVDADKIVVEAKDGKDTYTLTKFMRSNQGTLIHHKPVVRLGDKVDAGQVLADGSSTDNGELALGANLLVAFMPFEGFNFEDAIVISASGSSRTTSSRRSTSTSTRSTRARRSSATRRSRATSRTARRSRSRSSTSAASCASAPRSARATCSSAR